MLFATRLPLRTHPTPAGAPVLPLPSATLSVLCALILLSVEAGCPAPPPQRPRARTRVAPPSYPYRGKVVRVSERIHVIDHTKTREIGLQYQTIRGGLQQPVALVGIDVRRRAIRWTKPLPIQLRDPTIPWSFEIARNVTYLAVWTRRGTIRALDIYGRDAWETKMTGLLGVAKVGEGFVSAKGTQLYFIERRSGKTTPVVDLGAPITAPPIVLSEGEVVVLTGSFLVGVNLDAPKGKQVLFRHRLKLPEGLEPLKPQVESDTLVVGARAVPLVIKTEVSRLDPTTLKPRWRTLVPGRVRSHHSLHVDAREIRLLNRVPGEPDHLYVLNAKDGRLVSKQPATERRGCYLTKSQMVCVTTKSVKAFDRRSLRPAWTREMLDDVTGNQHLPYGNTFFIAEGRKVVGVQPTGKVSFSFELKAPPFRPRVNRILGVVNGVLVITVADWVRGRGMGQIWGVDLKTGRRKWLKRLPAPAYTERSVALLGDRVFFADRLFSSVCRADSGIWAGRWPHGLRAPVTKIPTVRTQRGAVWIWRTNRLALLNPKTGRILWRHTLAPGDRPLQAGLTHFFLRLSNGKIQALSLKTGKAAWTAPWDPTLTPKIVETPGGVILSRPSRAVLLEPATGKQKTLWKPGGWQLSLLGETPIMVRVISFRPKVAGALEVVRFDREGGKAERVWHRTFPYPSKAHPPLSPTVKRPFPWYHLAGDLVLLPSQGGRCLKGLDLDQGKYRWTRCGLATIAPPREYEGVLYVATGPYHKDLPEPLQGLVALRSEDGTPRRLFRIPRHGEERFLLPQYGPIVDGEYFALTQGGRLRQLLVAPPRRH